MSVPLVTLNSNQISLSRTVSLEYPVKLFDILMRLAREAFMPKEFPSLKTYLKTELALLDKRFRTKEKTASLTVEYLTKSDDYMIERTKELWGIIQKCVVATQPTSKERQFTHRESQDFIGNVGIGAFMDELKKHATKAKEKRGLLAIHVVIIYKIFDHLKKVNDIASGKNTNFTVKYLDIETTLPRKNYEKLFPNQKYYRIVISNQIEQLEAAILSGKDHTDEGILEEAAKFQVDYENMPRPRLLPLPAPAFNVSHPIAGMGLNTGYTPGGNAPVMVPTYAMSNNRGGLAFGYQASV